jgi:hypothetical protein
MFWGSEPIFKVRDPRYTIWARRENSLFSYVLAIFVGYSTQFQGSGPIFTVRNPNTRFDRVVKTPRFRIFRLFSWAIAHSFGVPGRSTRSVTPGTWFLDRRENSPFSQILAVFVGYNTRY